LDLPQPKCGGLIVLRRTIFPVVQWMDIDFKK